MAENSGRAEIQIESLVDAINDIKTAAIIHGVCNEVAAAIAHADLVARRIRNVA